MSNSFILDTIIRFGLALVIILGGLLVYWAFNKLILQKTRDKSEDLPFELSGNPVILYFTTPNCMPCKTVQRPALQKVRDKLADRIDIVEVDATQKPSLARQWSVLSVPTTFIIDTNGKTRFVNHGVARADKLIAQIQQLV